MSETTDEIRTKYERLRSKFESLASASLTTQVRLATLEGEIARLGAENKRLSAELEGQKTLVQMLGTDANTRYDAQNAEVERLRGLLRSNGVAIGG